MTTHLTTLSNGLRVVTESMAHLETVALGVWYGVGARHETAKQAGISHLLEHMAFKGTKKRSARAIAEEIEQVGGDLNAATGAETTAYYARVLKGDDRVALEILADILQNSVFAADELAREREVILQEIAGIQDSPDEVAYDLFHDAAFPGQAVGRPIIGTRQSVSSINGPALRSFLRHHYNSVSTVIAAVGAVDHDSIVRHAEALFGGLTRGTLPQEESARYVGGARASDKLFEQTHVLIGFEAPAYGHPRMLTAQVLSGLVGGGMSSRLFQEIRERRGLAYAIYSSAWGLRDTGLFAIHAATGDEMAEELIAVLGAEMQKLLTDAPAEREVARAKAQLKAGVLMAYESASARAEQLARQILGHGRLIERAELIGRIDAVAGADLSALVEEFLARPISAAVVGAGPRSSALAQSASQVLA